MKFNVILLIRVKPSKGVTIDKLKECICKFSRLYTYIINLPLTWELTTGHWHYPKDKNL
jgi:hypothetical protein